MSYIHLDIMQLHKRQIQLVSVQKGLPRADKRLGKRVTKIPAKADKRLEQCVVTRRPHCSLLICHDRFFI